MRIKYRPKSVYVGITLIAISILFNKWLIENIFVPDQHLESFYTIIFIVLTELISFIFGFLLILKRPKFLDKVQFTLIISGLFIGIITLESGSRIWLNYIAVPEDFDKYALYKDIDPIHFRYTPHHYLHWVNTPNFRKGLTYHNSLGYRGEEFPIEKPDSIYRIVAIGGSSTYSGGVTNNKMTFTAQLQGLLNNDYGHENVQVINAGVSAYDSWNSLINLEFRILDIDPNLIVIYHGYNDLHARFVNPKNYRSDNSGKRRYWSDPYIPYWERSTFLRILSRKTGFTHQVALGDFINIPSLQHSSYFGEDPMEILIKNPPIYYRRNLRNMIAIAKEYDINIMLATWAYSPNFLDYPSTPHYQAGIKEHNDVMKLVAENHTIPIFDFHSQMPQDKKYWSDGPHVNESGAAIKAKLFADFINSHILTHNLK